MSWGPSHAEVPVSSFRMYGTLISAELGEQPALRLSVSGLGFFVLKV